MLQLPGWLLVRWRRKGSYKVSTWHLRQHDAQRCVHILPSWQATARAERYGMLTLHRRLLLYRGSRRGAAMPWRNDDAGRCDNGK